MVKEKGKKNITFSFMRVVATLCVVLLHTCYMSVSLYGSSITEAERVGSLTVTHIMMAAVPSFIMVTGALLLDPGKNVPLKKLFTRYIGRVLLSLIVFSIIYKLFDILMSGGTERLSLSTIKDLFLGIATGTGWSYLWYLYMLIALYLLLPVFKAVTKSCSHEIIDNRQENSLRF